MNQTNEILARTDHNIEEVQIETTEEEREEGISLDDMLNEIEEQETRDGQMMLFDKYRKAIGGTAHGWGRKVFFKSIMDIGLIQECANVSAKSTRKCPTEEAMENKPHYFFYDSDGDIWGFKIEAIPEIRRDVLPVLSARAEEVRTLFLEEERLKKEASQVANRRGRTRLF